MGGPACLVIDTPPQCAHFDEIWPAVRTLLQDFEQRYSRYRPDSLVSMINRRAGSKRFTAVDEETHTAGLRGPAMEGLGRVVRYHIGTTPPSLAISRHRFGRTRAYCIRTGARWLASRTAGSKHSPAIGRHGNRPGGLVKEYAVTQLSA